MANSDEKSSPIPPDMLRSRCAIRISYRLPFNSTRIVAIEDYRYTEWDERMHHEQTPEEYADHPLEVDTKTVSHFVVHRLIRSSAHGKLVEISGHCPHAHLCNCTQDYALINAILDSRIEVHQIFHKERVARFVKPKPDQRSQEIDSELAEIAERIISKIERDFAEAESRISEPKQKEAAVQSGEC